MMINTFLGRLRPRHVREAGIRREWRKLEGASVHLADFLEEAFRARDHRESGWARFDDWAEQMFGIPARQAWTFLYLGQRLRELPKTRLALLRGELGYTKAREFVSLATPENEGEWIEFAQNHTSRALERRVRRARAGAGDEKEHFSAFYDGVGVFPSLGAGAWRAPLVLLQGTAAKPMLTHRRGAATPQKDQRRRHPKGSTGLRTRPASLLVAYPSG